MLQAFIESSKSHNKINPQEFWTLREFYAPGLLTIDKQATRSPFLLFHSDKIKSTEELINPVSISRKLKVDFSEKTIDFKTNTEVIFHDNYSMNIQFIKPITEMITANAVYDYKDKDKKFLENKWWFVDTTIKLR